MSRIHPNQSPLVAALDAGECRPFAHETAKRDDRQLRRKPLKQALLSRLLVALLLLAGGTSAFGQAMATIRGRATFRDAAGTISPIRNAVVELVDHNWRSPTVWSPRVVVAAITDQDGNFSMDYNPHEGEGFPNSGNVDPLIFVHFNETGGTPGRVVTNGSADYYGYGFPYGGYSLTNWMYDLPEGVHDLGTLTVDSATVGIHDDPWERFWQVRDWMQQDRDRLAELGFPLPSLFNFWLHSSTRTLLKYDRRPYDGNGSSGVMTEFSLNDASRAVVSRYMGMHVLFHLVDARHDPAVFPAYPNETAATLPVRQVTPQVALVEGFGLFVAALIKGDPLVNNGSSTNPYLFNIELNHDGWGAANGNSDQTSDLSGRTGDLSAASVAAMFWDLNDMSDLTSDPFDRSAISLQDLLGVLDTYKPDGYRPPHSALEVLNGYYNQGRPLLPMVAGAAQIHGMTLDRITRPTIGLTALSVGSGPFFWNGPISGSMTVRNFGSQNYDSLGSGSWHLRLDSPTHAIFPGNAMLVRTTGVEDLPSGWSRTVAASVPAIWPGARATGTYNLRGIYVTNDGLSRVLQVAADDLANPLPVPMSSDGTAPMLTVLDDGTYQSSDSDMRVRAFASDIESGIVRYEVAIGTAPGLTDVKHWQTFITNATVLEQVITDFSPWFGDELFATVRVTNGEGLTQMASSDGIRVDGLTLPPSLFQPSTGSFTGSPILVVFFLPEDAQPGTLTLEFSGPATSTVTMISSLEYEGYHSLYLNHANLLGNPLVAAVTGANSLPNGLYSVTLRYRDRAGNPLASHTNYEITLDTTTPVIDGLFSPLVLDAGAPMPNYVPQAFVSDSGSGVASIVQYPAAGTPVSIGLQRVTLTATDLAGNAGTRAIWVEGLRTGINHAPTDIGLDTLFFPENTEPDYVVGTLAATDADTGDSAVFSLIAGAGSDHNGLFNISGSELRLTNPVDFEASPATYSIRIQAADTGGATFEKVISLVAINRNEMPSFIAGPSLMHSTTAVGPQLVAGWAMGMNDGDSTRSQFLTFHLMVDDPHGALATDPAIDSTSGDLNYELTGHAGTVTIQVSLTDDNTIDGIPRSTLPQIFTLTIGPKIQVRGNGVVIANSDASPSLDDHTDFGEALVRGGLVVRTFSIWNRGEDSLAITDVTVTGDQPGFSVASRPLLSLPPDESTTFEISFDPALPGVVNGLVTILSNDPDAATFTYAITGTGTGTGPAPEIEVRGNAIVIENGDSTPASADRTDFGGVILHTGYAPHEFTIHNHGDADLAIGALLIEGTNATDFAVLTPPDSPVPPGGSTSCVVAFTPLAAGERHATLSFNSTDADEDPYAFAIQGTGYPDGITIPPFLYSPTEGGAVGSPIFVHYYMNENSLPGSLKLSFVGPVSTTLTLDPSIGTEGSRSLDINPENLLSNSLVSAAVGSTTLPDGVYTVTLTCQDAAGNPAANDTRTNVTLDTISPAISGSFSPLRFAAGSLLPDYTGQAVVTDVGSGLASLIQTPPEGSATAVGILTITLTATDRAGNQTTHSFEVEAFDDGSNTPPFAIHLSHDRFPENSLPNHVVGLLTADDADPADTAAFTLVSGSGSDDNALFQIVGNELRLTSPINFETSPGAYSVRIRATDAALAHFDAMITLYVTNVNEMPSFIAGPNQMHPTGSIGAQTIADWAQNIDSGDGSGVQSFSFLVSVVDPAGILALPPSIDSATGALSYHLSGLPGMATVQVALTDDDLIDGVALTTATQTFTITVGSGPVPPVLAIRIEDDPVYGRVIVVSWPTASDVTLSEPILQSSPSPAGPWTTVDAGEITSTGIIHQYRLPLATGPSHLFFRLAY